LAGPYGIPALEAEGLVLVDGGKYNVCHNPQVPVYFPSMILESHLSGESYFSDADHSIRNRLHCPQWYAWLIVFRNLRDTTDWPHGIKCAGGADSKLIKRT